ncbi:MAG: hypothetical protein R6V27_11180 [Balneolaceae bacterium]
MSKTPSPSTGGIIWKNIAGHQRIAIISSDGVDNGWKLPVYKRDEYSTLKEDPFKAIGQLAGADVKQPVAAETVFYPDWDPPEFVVFWHLRVKAASGSEDPVKNHHVKWVTLPKAKKLLTDPAEKKLVDKISFPHDYYTNDGSSTTLFYSYTPEQSKRPNRNILERLEGDLRAHSAILEHQIRENSLEDGSIPTWGEQAGALVNMAYEQMKRGLIDSSWKSLLASKRLSILGMTQTQINALAKRIRLEADNLNTWRKKAVHHLLGEHESKDNPPDAASVYLAAEIRDEHFSNVYYKNRLTQSVVNNLLYWIGATAFLIIIYFITASFTVSGSMISVSAEARNLQLVPLLPGIILFGLFGGSMSAIFKVKSTSTNLRNPELIHSHFFTSVRVFTGGAASLAFFVLMESEFLEFIPAAMNLRPTSEFTYFAISFVCGFSERLLLRTVSSISENS